MTLRDKTDIPWPVSTAPGLERIERLERLVCKLADALLRRNSDQDGGCGFPSCNGEMREILDELGFDFKDVYRGT
jgi:hypothetical protein